MPRPRRIFKLNNHAFAATRQDFRERCFVVDEVSQVGAEIDGEAVKIDGEAEVEGVEIRYLYGRARHIAFLNRNSSGTSKGSSSARTRMLR